MHPANHRDEAQGLVTRSQWAWIGVILLLLLSATFFMQPTPTQASKLLQSTATATATATATNTPTSTPTPIATQLPQVSGAQGLYNGVRVGNYGVPTPSTNGSAFQSTVGSIDLYSSTGRHTVSIDNATGNVIIYGTLTTGTGADTMSFTKVVTAATVISGTTVAHGLSFTPSFAICQQNDLQPTTFTQTIYARNFTTQSVTIGVSEGSVVTFTAVSCIVGKP